VLAAVHAFCFNAEVMLSDTLRREIERSERSRYALSRDTGINQSVLSRFVNGHTGLSLANADRLAEALGLRLVKKLAKGRR